MPHAHQCLPNYIVRQSTIYHEHGNRDIARSGTIIDLILLGALAAGVTWRLLVRRFRNVHCWSSRRELRVQYIFEAKIRARDAPA